MTTSTQAVSTPNHRHASSSRLGLAALLLLPTLAFAQEDPAPTPPPPPPAPDRGAVIATTSGKLLEYRTAEARAALEPLAATATTDGEIARELGKVLEQEKRYDEAAASLSKAAELLPGDPRPWIDLGEVYLRQSRQADADGAFARASESAQARLAANPDDPAALLALGTAQLRTRQLDAAVATLTKAAERDAANPMPLLHLGVTLAYKGDWQASYDRLTQAIERSSGLAYAYFYRGMSADRLGRKDVLVNDLERFLTLAPEAPEAARAASVVAAAKR